MIITVVLYLFNHYIHIGYRMNFYGNTKFNTVRDFIKSQGHSFTVLQRQIIERGNGTFITAKTINYPSQCGITNITFTFFEDELSCIYLNDISEEEDIMSCATKGFKIYKSKNSDTSLSISKKNRSVAFCDPVVRKRENEWISKWS